MGDGVGDDNNREAVGVLDAESTEGIVSRGKKTKRTRQEKATSRDVVTEVRRNASE